MADKKEEVKVEPVKVETVVETVVDPLAEKDAQIAKLTVERDNYKTVALARKGKLPADNELLGEDFDGYIKAKVQETLADTEIGRAEADRKAETARIIRENAELKLALKNRPGSGLGSDSGTTSEVTDNVLTAQQIEVLKQTAIRLKTDPDKYVEKAKQNLLKNGK